MLNPILKEIHLCNNEYKEYARQLILSPIGINGQKRIKKAKIIFIGAGGLASSAIIYLIALGIEEVGIIDHDRVSISNLHRQILYTKKNIKELKVNAAKDKIYDTKNNCKINTYPYKLTHNNSQKIIKAYDIVIDTCDNFKTRYIVDKICYQLHKVHIYGAVGQFQGQVSVFNYKSGPKYSDLYPKSLKLQDNNCNLNGVIGILPGIIGLLQAIEAVKIIVGIREVLSGKILIYNSINISFQNIKIKTHKIPKQTFNSYNKKIINKEPISETELKQLLISNNVLIIDVRQNLEFKKSHILKAINIPIKSLYTKNSLKFLANYCNSKTLIIYCNNNSRSTIASKILHKNKIKHYRTAKQ